MSIASFLLFVPLQREFTGPKPGPLFNANPLASGSADRVQEVPRVTEGVEFAWVHEQV